MTKKHVVICMEWMPSYRRGFYEALEPRLAESDISMTVVHGLPPASRSQRQDHSEPEWAELVMNREVSVKGTELTWQPVWNRAKSADLIILQQEAANLFNYLALAMHRVGGPPVALWGHGENPDPATSNPLAERLKRFSTPFGNWFFAYTERSAAIFRSMDIPASRITVVNNSRAADNVAYSSEDASAEIAELCAEVTARSQNIGWMSSALDSSKRIPFLIETLDQVRAMVNDFEFFVLGRGSAEHLVDAAARTRPWLHAVGARFGSDKVAIGEVARLTIHPGLLGLHVVDAFAFQTPIVTTEFTSHSHEFDYLDDGVNARILGPDASAIELGAAVSAILRDEELLHILMKGCKESGTVYTLEAMVERFHDGVLGALATR